MKRKQSAREDAVSPVIGVILMVAITVVLAAVVFVLVSNLSDTNEQAPDIGFAKDESDDRINVVSTDSGLLWSEFRLVSDDAAAQYFANQAPQATDQLVTASATGGVVATPADLAAGNHIAFCVEGGTTNVNVRVVHIETNTQVYETDFATVGDCP